MIVYLDTNVVLWLGKGDLKRISLSARRVLQSADLRISPVVLIELEYLHEVGRVRLSARGVLRKLAQEVGLAVCDLSFPSVADAALDEKWTRDPFDRTIVAQAKANGLAPLISADEEIRKHYPRTVW